MKSKIITVLAAGALMGLSAQAQDKALLETLVKKGMLSQQEAAQIAKENVAVTPGSSETKSIKISGGVAGWYNWSQVDLSGNRDSLSQTNAFTMRYVKLGVEADVGGGWDVKVMTDFGAEGERLNYIDEVTISKKIDVEYLKGAIDFGFKKVNFGQEQMEDDFNQLAIERSVATWFFTRPSMTTSNSITNFGSRSTGIFWNGEISQLEGLYYGASVTGGATESLALDTKDTLNKLSFFFNAGYKNYAEIQGEGLSYDLGINYGYANGGMYSIPNDTTSSMWSINPYMSAKWRGLTLMAEYFFAQMEDAKLNGADADPQGWNVTVAWKQDLGEWGAIEPLFRYSHLNTNGAMFNTDYGIDYNGTVTGLQFNEANTFYFGANWYAVPAVKFSLGYEFSQYDQLADYGNASANAVKAQIQVIF